MGRKENLVKAISPVIPKSLIEAIKNTFLIQANTPIQIISMELRKTDIAPNIEVIAVIGLHSSQYQGNLALCFPKNTILGVINKMLGENNDELTNENSDAAGELLNIVYASARTKINESGIDFKPAIPSVIRGKDIRVSHGNQNQVTVVHCECEFGYFHVEVSLKNLA